MGLHTSTLMVTGSAHISGSLDVGGSVGNVHGDLTVGNDLYVAGDISVSGSVDMPNLRLTGDLQVDGGDIKGSDGTIAIHLESDEARFVGDAYAAAGLFVSGSFKVGSGASVTTVLDEDNLSSDSATALATQQSIKAYVDASTPATLGAITNVNTTDNAKANGHVLIWDNGQSRWENAAIAGTANEVEVTNAAGAITLGLPNDVLVAGVLTVGADADGTDRKLTFGHSTLKTSIGIDDSADVFAINTDANFESGNDLEIDASGNVTIHNGDLKIGGGDIYGPTDAQLRIRSDANVVIQLDEDNDGTNKFVIWNNAETSKFEVDESGNVQMDGSVTIGSNTILASDGGTAITLDTSDNVTIGNDLTVDGGDIVLGSDADGTDRTIVFGHSTLKTRMGIDDSADLFVINTDTSFEGTPANNSLTIDASHNLGIAGDLTIGGNDIKNADGETTITMDADQRVGIGGISPTYKLDVNGDIRLRGNDIRDNSGNPAITFDGSANTSVVGTATVAGGSLSVEGTNPTLTVGDGGDEDIKILFNSNTNDFYIGSDATDDALHIGAGSTVGTTSAITITSGSYVQLVKGNKFSPAIKVAPDYQDTDSGDEWIKVAEHKTGLSQGSYDAALGTFLVAFSGLGHNQYDVLQTFIVHVQWSDNNNTPADWSPATHVSVQELDYYLQSDVSGQVTLLEAHDFVLTWNGGVEAALWARCPVNYGHLNVTHMGGTSAENIAGSAHGAAEGWTVCTPEDGAHFQASYTDLGAKKVGELVKKKFASLELTGSVYATDIKDEDNMASNSQYALATQQSIKAYVDASSTAIATVAGSNITFAQANLLGPADADLYIKSDAGIILHLDDDNDTTNNFRIRNGADVQVFQVSETGAISGPTDGAMEIRSDGNLEFYIDDDNDSASAEFRWYDDTTERMVLDQTGNLQIDGDLTISGGNITNTITLDNGLRVNGSAGTVGISEVQCENNTATGGFAVIEAAGGSGETIRIWHDGDNRRIDGGVGDGTLYINKPHTGVGVVIGGECRVAHDSGQADFVSRGTPSNSVSNGDNFGGVYFYGSEDATNYANCGGFLVEAADDNWNYSSNAHTKMKFWVNHGGGTAEVLYIDGSDSSVDPKVGINTGSPTAYLHVLAVNRGTDDGIPAALIDGHTGYSASQGVLKVHSQDTGCQTSDVLLRVESSDTTMTNSCYFIGFYTDSTLVGGIDSEVAYDTFTGCHPTDILPEDASGIRQGMILKSTGEIFYRDSGISNAWCRTKATSSAKDKAAVGVYNKLSAWGVSRAGEIINPTPEGRQYHRYNAIGEGQILVTDEGGNIETGDYICSSNRLGHGMLQDDDLLHNYTVAKATEPVDFSTVDIDPELGFKSKLIACTYHAG